MNRCFLNIKLSRLIVLEQTLRRISVLFLACLIVTLCSCKKWLDINHNPNSPVESNTTPDMVLAGALLQTAANNSAANQYFVFLNNWMGYWCPPAGLVANDQEQSYNITTNFNTAIFTSNLSNSNNYNFIEERAIQNKQDFYQGIARIMKVHNFAILVDMYNNVPYLEALQGINGYTSTKYLFPHYDDGKMIYEDLVKRLDTAISLVKEANLEKNTNISSTDIMFKGSKLKWVKFANTLKLRLLIHQASRSDRISYIQTEVAKIVAEGSGFLGSGENASVNPVFVQTPANQVNPYYNSYGFNTTGAINVNIRANIIALNFLKNDKDPRIGFFYKKKSNSGNQPITLLPQPFAQLGDTNFRGNQYGLPINTSIYPYQGANFTSPVGGVSSAGAITSSSSGILKGFNMDIWILTSVESMFLQAEAILRGWFSGDPQLAYTNAIKESFRWLNVGGNSGNASLSDNVFNSWYSGQVTNSNINWDLASDKYRLLMYQKYIAMNGIAPLETWTDYRRNSFFPNIPLSDHPSRTSNSVPIRLLYPQKEYDVNTLNVTAQGVINQFTSKVWWMP